MAKKYALRLDIVIMVPEEGRELFLPFHIEKVLDFLLLILA